MPRTEFPEPDELTGDTVRKLRLETGLSVSDFNELCRFPQRNVISRIEKKNDFYTPGERKVIIRVLKEYWDNKSKLVDLQEHRKQDDKTRLKNGRPKGMSANERAERLTQALQEHEARISADDNNENDELDFVITESDEDVDTSFDLSSTNLVMSNIPIELGEPNGVTSVELRESDFAVTPLEKQTDEYTKLISNSEVQTWNRCRRKWWLQWYRQLTSNYHDYLSPLDIGNRVHRALAAYYVPDGQTPTDPRDALERAIVDDWTQIAAQFNGDETEQRFADLASQYNDAVALERAMIEGYVDWIAETGVDQNLVINATETALHADFDVDLGYVPKMREHDVRTVRVIGLIDARATRITDGARVFIDHKTVQNFAMRKKVLHLDTQMLHYHLLEYLNTQDGDNRCDGALYNMLRKVKRTRNANPPFFEREFVRHNQYEIDAYKTRLLGATHDILLAQDQLAAGVNHLEIVYPNPEESCSYSCPFFSICNMFDDNSRAEDAVAGLFHQENPLKRYDGFINNGE